MTNPCWFQRHSCLPDHDLLLYFMQEKKTYNLRLLTSVWFLSCVCCVVCFHCLSRIPVQRPGAQCGGGPRSGGAAVAPRVGGCQLLFPASLRPADVHHAHALQQENSHQWQGQRNGGGQGCIPVSIYRVRSLKLL